MPNVLLSGAGRYLSGNAALFHRVRSNYGLERGLVWSTETRCGTNKRSIFFSVVPGAPTVLSFASRGLRAEGLDDVAEVEATTQQAAF